MSWLFPLAIRGAGTSHVEALSSYLLRLARVHGTVPGTFLSFVIERYCWPDAPRRTGILQSPIEHVATHPGVRFPPHGVSDVLRSLLDEAWNDGSEETLYRVLPRDECIRFTDPTEPLTLVSALRIAFWLNTPLVNLLLGRLQGTNRSILESAKETLPTAIAPRRRRRIGNARMLGIEAAHIVETASEALSLTEVARKLGVSVGALRYHLPSQSNEIIQAYLVSRRRRRASISTQCRSNVRKAIVRWAHVESRPFSKKGLLFALRASTGLPKNVLREEIKRQITGSTAGDGMRGAK